MSTPFPDIPTLRGNFAPILMECDALDLPVVGTLPDGLAGTLYRNGPNPQYAPPDPKYHWFLGDGMVHAFRIEDGRVSYRNRWVRTPKWELEHSAGRALFGSWGDPRTTDPLAADKDDGIANTNIVWHAGRLLALEEAHLPFEVDPSSLTSRGYCDFSGKLKSQVTAHPKIDPVTGELVFFGYSVAGPFTPAMAYGVVDIGGTLKTLQRFEAPFASMVHDFIVTRDHVLFPILPLTGSMERARRGLPPYAWEPACGAHVGIMRRDGGVSSMRWFTGEPCYMFHALNAWDEGDRVVAYVMQSEAAPLFPLPDGTPGDPKKASSRLCRWTFDLAGNSNTFKQDYVDDLTGEFPRLDERFTGAKNRHGFYAAHCRPADEPTFDGIARIDLVTGRRELFTVPASDALSEPVFVPRTSDAPEAEGWLLTVAWRGEERRSDLLVLDAGALGDGPVATVQLSHRVPFGFHGNWRPDA